MFLQLQWPYKSCMYSSLVEIVVVVTDRSTLTDRLDGYPGTARLAFGHLLARGISKGKEFITRGVIKEWL